MVNQQVVSQQKAPRQGVSRQRVPRQHWALRVLSYVSWAASVAFALANAHAVYWYYSAMDKVDGLQPFVTMLFAIGFVLASFVLGRALASLLQVRGRGQFGPVLVVVLCITLLFEAVEVSCCFSEAAYSIHFMVWIGDGGFTGGLLNVLRTLPYVILPISPVLAIGLGCLDVVLHHQKHGGGVPALQPGQVPIQAAGGGAPLPSSVPQSSVPSRRATPVQNGSGYSPLPAQPKLASPSVPVRGATPVQNGRPPLPAQDPVVVPEEPYRMRPGQMPSHPSETRVLTGPLGVSSDDETLITQSQLEGQSEGGSWLSRLPFVGRRQKEPDFSKV